MYVYVRKVRMKGDTQGERETRAIWLGPLNKETMFIFPNTIKQGFDRNLGILVLGPYLVNTCVPR